MQEIWCFVDDMDLAELRRQRVKFGLKNENDAFEMKKALFLLVKHQVRHAYKCIHGNDVTAVWVGGCTIGVLPERSR